MKRIIFFITEKYIADKKQKVYRIEKKYKYYKFLTNSLPAFHFKFEFPLQNKISQIGLKM